MFCLIFLIVAVPSLTGLTATSAECRGNNVVDCGENYSNGVVTVSGARIPTDEYCTLTAQITFDFPALTVFPPFAQFFVTQNVGSITRSQSINAQGGTGTTQINQNAILSITMYD